LPSGWDQACLAFPYCFGVIIFFFFFFFLLLSRANMFLIELSPLRTADVV